MNDIQNAFITMKHTDPDKLCCIRVDAFEQKDDNNKGDNKKSVDNIIENISFCADDVELNTDSILTSTKPRTFNFTTQDPAKKVCEFKTVGNSMTRYHSIEASEKQILPVLQNDDVYISNIYSDTMCCVIVEDSNGQSNICQTNPFNEENKNVPVLRNANPGTIVVSATPSNPDL
jgi:hypothetical protein